MSEEQYKFTKQDCIGCREYCKLEQENQELKKQYSKLEDKYFKNTPCCNENDCLLYKRYFDTEIILTEFEKWLEEKIKCTEQYADNDMAKDYINAMKLCKYYLQELKERR